MLGLHSCFSPMFYFVLTLQPISPCELELHTKQQSPRLFLYILKRYNFFGKSSEELIRYALVSTWDLRQVAGGPTSPITTIWAVKVIVRDLLFWVIGADECAQGWKSEHILTLLRHTSARWLEATYFCVFISLSEMRMKMRNENENHA